MAFNPDARPFLPKMVSNPIATRMGYNPIARPFLPFRSMSGMDSPLTPLPATPTTPTTNDTVAPCKALINYHSCLCREREPLWSCSKRPCDHTRSTITIMVSSMPYACRAKTNAGSRSFKKHEDGGRHGACHAEDPANKRSTGLDVDAAGGLKTLILPGLDVKMIDEVVPAFIEDGKCWHQEVQARYEKLLSSLAAKDDDKKDESDSDGFNSDDDSSVGFNSDSDTDDDDDDDTVSPFDPVMMAWLQKAVTQGRPTPPAPIPAPIARRPSSSTTDVNDDDNDDADDEDEDDDLGEQKSKKGSLSNLVAESDPLTSKK
ncbi:uncharacterized protein PG998_003402 [Apiospora kogelbergensis]|uniref:SWIM-type domain-containing protein n=1 Tax=Apiospora kogelbergensis TaxID=1337665 RepID=A0AAW0QLD6_9PEZI